MSTDKLLRDVLDAAVTATWALAHACEKDATYRNAYDALSELTPKLRAALAQPPAPEQQALQGFPKRIMDLLRSVADRKGTETAGPWEDGNGDPLQDDADAAIAWIESASPVAPEAAKPETELAARLLAHAEAHSSVSPYDQEQQDWENDLRQAAALLAADSKAGGEVVAWLCPSRPPYYYSSLTHWGPKPPPPLTAEEAVERGWFPVIKQEKSDARPQHQAKLLTQCSANRDGDCVHAQCPQLRDGEPAKSRRHCPLDGIGKDQA